MKIGRRRFRVLPSRYALLFVVWYSRNSSIQLHRLSLMIYLSPHVIKYHYESPPIVSRALFNDVNELIREGLLESFSAGGRLAVRVTDEGRRVVGELYGISDDYVLFGDYLIVRPRDLFNELMRIVNAYQDLTTSTLLSMALREWSIREGGLVSDVLRDVSFELRNPCEGRLG